MILQGVKLMLQRCSWARRAGTLPLGPILMWLAGLAMGCGRSALFEERHDGEPAPIRCHTGYELVDGVCQIKEIYFAGGTRTYPWGDEAPTCERANFDEEQCGHFGVEIGRFPPSPEGLYDMAGNVSEQVFPGIDDYTDGYPAPGIADPELCGDSPCMDRVFRGGCDESEAHELRGAHRVLGWEVDSKGFRCVRKP